MLGTISLIVCIILGALRIPIWWIMPIAIANGFIGLHFPQGKATALIARGQYWQTYLYSFPLQAVLAAVLYGVGYLISFAF